MCPTPYQRPSCYRRGKDVSGLTAISVTRTNWYQCINYCGIMLCFLWKYILFKSVDHTIIKFHKHKSFYSCWVTLKKILSSLVVGSEFLHMTSKFIHHGADQELWWSDIVLFSTPRPLPTQTLGWISPIIFVFILLVPYHCYSRILLLSLTVHFKCFRNS